MFNSLQLGNDVASQIEQVHRFKTPNEPEKIAPIQVTVKMDGNGGPMWTATEITKAAKCLKDNPNFKSVYINPDLTRDGWSIEKMIAILNLRIADHFFDHDHYRDPIEDRKKK